MLHCGVWASVLRWLAVGGAVVLVLVPPLVVAVAIEAMVWLPMRAWSKRQHYASGLGPPFSSLGKPRIKLLLEN